MPDEFDYPHEWAREPDGSIERVYLGDYHDGPKCLRCGETFCQQCDPDIFTAACEDQDAELFALPFTKTQMDARLKHLNLMGYIVRSGMIIGKQDPILPCADDEHKWTVKSRTERGYGILKQVTIVDECVVCYTTRVRN